MQAPLEPEMSCETIILASALSEAAMHSFPDSDQTLCYFSRSGLTYMHLKAAERCEFAFHTGASSLNDVALYYVNVLPNLSLGKDHRLCNDENRLRDGSDRSSQVTLVSGTIRYRVLSRTP